MKTFLAIQKPAAVAIYVADIRVVVTTVEIIYGGMKILAVQVAVQEKPVDNIESQMVDKPGSVLGNHSSGNAITDTLKQPT